MKTFEHAFNKALKTKSGRSTYALAALSYNTIISLIKQNQEIPKNLINNISIWPNWTSALVLTLIRNNKKVPQELFNVFKRPAKEKQFRPEYYYENISAAIKKYYNEEQLIKFLKKNPEFIEYII